MLYAFAPSRGQLSSPPGRRFFMSFRKERALQDKTLDNFFTFGIISKV